MSEEQHGSPRGGPSQELLYDPTIPSPTHAERARTLSASVPTGTLCTLGAGGYPYGSFVTFALHDGTPLFLISALAEHTKNLKADPRASLLVAEAGEGDPLARGRVTLVGRAVQVEAHDREPARAVFLAAHPSSAYYADFKDFGFWRLEVESARYIGGFGRMSWVTAEAWSAASPDPIAPSAAGILEHMNADHKETMLEYTRAFSRAPDASDAELVAVDRYGFEMAVATPEGPRPVRVAFHAAVESADEVRREMIALAKEARAILAARPGGR
jgi:putative heme iron utilization protein